jgi:RNA polymerase sigma-70 factor, ECF subfamily
MNSWAGASIRTQIQQGGITFVSERRQEEVRLGLPAHLARLWRYALALSHSRDAAEDLVQATCLRALERAGQFEPGTRLDRWLFAILRSVWLNDARARRIRLGQGHVAAETALVVDGEHEIETNISTAQVLKAIGGLPEAQREAVLLVYVEGYSYREAADLLGVPIGTIMSRLAAARLALTKTTRKG